VWLRKQPGTFQLTANPDVTVNVSTSESGATYEVSMGGQCYSYTARWWDTPRSIARKLQRIIDDGTHGPSGGEAH
jgi:hypothetical protein